MHMNADMLERFFLTSLTPLDPGLWPRERRCFVGKFRGRYDVYNRLAQGSRGAPLSWCRFFALVIRPTVALFHKDEFTGKGYVDDPIFTLSGAAKHRKRAEALIVLIWRTPNRDVAFRKSQPGHEVSWIGTRLLLSRSGIVAQLQGDTVMELKSIISGMLQQHCLAEGAAHARWQKQQRGSLGPPAQLAPGKGGIGS